MCFFFDGFSLLFDLQTGSFAFVFGKEKREHETAEAGEQKRTEKTTRVESLTGVVMGRPELFWP